MPCNRMDLLRRRWWKLVPDLSSLRFAYSRAPSGALLCIQIRVRERGLSSELPTDPNRRVRHTDVDTRGDEASKGRSLRSPTACAGRENRTEGESSAGGGPTSRIQDIRLEKLTTGVPGCLPYKGKQRGCLPWQQHKREEVSCGCFWLPEQVKLLPSSFAVTTRSRLVRCFGPIVPHCPPKTALTSFSSTRPPLSFISNANVSSKSLGSLSRPLRQPLPMSISLEIVPMTRRLELEGEPDGS